MTLPETLKAARIEAIAFWFAGRRRDADAPTDTLILPHLSDFEDARRVLAADPLEPIVEALVEALVKSKWYIFDHVSDRDIAPIIEQIDAALQKAGVR